MRTLSLTSRSHTLSLHRSRSGNIGMMALIFLAIISLLFGGLAYTHFQHTEALKSGSKDHKIKVKKSIRGLTTRISEENEKIHALQEELGVLNSASHQYDLKIAAHGEYYMSGYMVTESGTEAQPFSDFIGLLGINEVFTQQGRVNTRINHDFKELESWDKHFKSAQRQNLPKLQQIAVDFADATNDIIERSSSFEESKQNEIDRLQEDLEGLKDRYDELKNTQRYDESVALTQKAQLESKIRELLELELRWMKELDSDGKVLQTGIDFDFIIVNIGRKEGVTPGMRFDIFNHDRGNYVEKGRCEVIKVDETIATCRVVHINDRKTNPIATGDFIGNPVFDAVNPRSFYLAGEFKLYNKDDIARFIVKGGGVVLDQLQPGIDYLIAGDRSAKAQDQAREYNVLAMHEETIVKYLHTTFSTLKKK